jgi:hypothetical protein
MTQSQADAYTKQHGKARNYRLGPGGVKIYNKK